MKQLDQSIDELAQEAQIFYGSNHIILSDLKIKHVSVKFVLRLLYIVQMETQKLAVAECFEKSTEDLMFFKTISNKICVYSYDPETKIQSPEWHTSSPWSKRSHHVKSKTIVTNLKSKSNCVFWQQVWCTVNLWDLDKLLMVLHQILKLTNKFKEKCPAKKNGECIMIMLPPSPTYWFL